MKKSTQAIIALSSLLFTCSSALAGGVEAPPPTVWDVYIGGSAVGYVYSHRFNSAILQAKVPATAAPLAQAGITAGFPFPYSAEYQAITVLGGFDLGFGVWADRGYFGIEGRYDIGNLTQQSTFVYGTPFTTDTPQYENYYHSKINNNAFVLLKIGYRLLPRTMTYIVGGWARSSYRLSLRTFNASVGLPTLFQVNSMVEAFSGTIYRKSINGGTIGFGISHLLVDGLTAFAEFAATGLHVPTEIRGISPRDLQITSGPPSFIPLQTTVKSFGTDFLSFNFYYYNLRLGLNWSFAGLF